MNLNELKSAIYKNMIQNIYLFSGPEIGEKMEVIENIKEKIFDKEEPVVYNFYIDSEFNIQEFYDIMQTDLLFSSKKIVLLKNIEQINQNIIKIIERLIIPTVIKKSLIENILAQKSDKEKFKIIESMYDVIEDNFVLKSDLKENEKKKLILALNYFNIHSFSDKTYLIMLNETNEKIPNSLINLLTVEQHIVFWEMFEHEKSLWIKQEFKKKGFYIEDNAVNFIISTVENNKSQFENVIHNITTFLKLKDSKNNLIDKNLIEDYLYHSKEESAFTFYQSLLEGNLLKALEILEKIFYTEDEIILLNGILWSHRRFLCALDMYENQNLSEEAIFNELNVKIRKVKEEITNGLKKYNFKDMCLMTYYILELDYYLKTLPEDLKLVKLQEFVVKFIYGSNRKSFLQGEILYLLY